MIIALLTDFGTQDYFVGAMKGVILSVNRHAAIVDITHEIAPQDINSASFILRNCYAEFPAKTIFIAVVDPDVGSSRRAILVETEKYFFIAPDNGLLSFVFEKAENYKVFEISREIFFRQPVSQTFHGRDIFAPCAAHLSRGVKPYEFGNEINDFVVLAKRNPKRVSKSITEAEIVFVDRFGNLISSLKAEDLPDKFYLEINDQKIEKLRDFFAEAEPGELFMIMGSAGFLEIAAFKNSAKDLLNVEIGQKIFVNLND
jgi:S-adenosyl-L-methionine hydrolase (adenosine-forming)